MFEKYHDGNAVLRDLCGRENIHLIETMPALFNGLKDEIGYNAFMDGVHFNLHGNQIIANKITEKIFELGLMKNVNADEFIKLSSQADAHEILKRESFPLNSQCYSLLGWQKLVCINAAKNQGDEKKEIVKLANQAIKLDPQNSEAYFFLALFIRLRGIIKTLKKYG